MTWPNNPDGRYRQPLYPGAGLTVYDLAYYWPATTNVTVPIDEDVMVFTAAKVLFSLHAQLCSFWLCHI